MPSSVYDSGRVSDNNPFEAVEQVTIFSRRRQDEAGAKKLPMVRNAQVFHATSADADGEVVRV